MLKDPLLDLEAAGMGAADVYKIIGEASSVAVLAEMAERVAAARDIHTATQKSSDEHSTDYYLVVVFRDPKARLAATERLGLDDNRYVSGDELMARLVALMPGEDRQAGQPDQEQHPAQARAPTP